MSDRPKACPDCQWSGWVDVAVHTYRPNGLRIATYAAACSCELGRRHAMNASTLHQVLTWAASQHGVEVFYTTRNHYPLTREERMTPQQIEALERTKVPKTKHQPKPFAVGGE